MNRCPNCYQPMNASAIIERFSEPAGWQFYGAPGARRIRCRGVAQDGTGYIHFIVTENGREYHRLAYGIAADLAGFAFTVFVTAVVVADIIQSGRRDDE